eukprot:3293450-Ditylum_brightwellii.AAC.1
MIPLAVELSVMMGVGAEDAPSPSMLSASPPPSCRCHHCPQYLTYSMDRAIDRDGSCRQIVGIF